MGFGVSEVTRDLHADGIHGVMTDYEEKFHNLGTPINRCVGTMGPLPEVPELQQRNDRAKRSFRCMAEAPLLVLRETRPPGT